MLLEVIPKVITYLNEYIREELDKYWKEKKFSNRAQFLYRDKTTDHLSNVKNFSNGIRNCSTHNFDTFGIDFTIYDENRRLMVYHNCSSDYSDIYQGNKIIFSFNKWGMSEEIMMVVVQAIKEFGDVYYIGNDYEDEFRKL